MYFNAHGLLKRRLLAMLTACLLLPLALTGQVGKASPAGQTPSPTPSPTPSKPILLTDPVPDPQQDGVMYFSQTGHTLRGKFLDYWQQNGGLSQFGYPLTEEFFEPDGPDDSFMQVQYFERNRFELHPENQPPNDVLLGSLGLQFHQPESGAPPDPGGNVYFFGPTSHNVSGVFLQYWRAHGGLAVYGYPINEARMETSTNGKQYLTQWFQRSRFELHPENAGTEYEVLLGLLGRQLSEKRGYPYGWYPHFGYAVDYSWVAGYLELYDDGPGFFTTLGCSIFRYGEADLKVQLTEFVDIPYRSGGYQFTFPKSKQGKDLRVVYGRLATNEDQIIYGCPADAAPNYFVNSIQGNPTHQ
jgi:hypothetical protein